MAGVTREARAASERLPDRISIGVLGRTFTDELPDEVTEAAEVRERRYRLLPGRGLVLFTLACCLFMRSGHLLVMAKLAHAQRQTSVALAHLPQRVGHVGCRREPGGVLLPNAHWHIVPGGGHLCARAGGLGPPIDQFVRRPSIDRPVDVPVDPARTGPGQRGRAG